MNLKKINLTDILIPARPEFIREALNWSGKVPGPISVKGFEFVCSSTLNFTDLARLVRARFELDGVVLRAEKTSTADYTEYAGDGYPDLHYSRVVVTFAPKKK